MRPVKFGTNGTSVLAASDLIRWPTQSPEDLQSYTPSNSGVMNLRNHRIQTLVNPQTGTIHVLAYDPNCFIYYDTYDISISGVYYLRYENGQWSTPKFITRSPFAVMTLDVATDTPSVHGIQTSTTMGSYQRLANGSWSVSSSKPGFKFLHPFRPELSGSVDVESVGGHWNMYIHDRLADDNSLKVRSLP